MTKSSVRKSSAMRCGRNSGRRCGRPNIWRWELPANPVIASFKEAVLHLQRTGSPWRDLPPKLGYWHAVYMRFRRWEARGVWQRLWKNSQAEPFAGARGLLLDSTTVRASTKLHAATLDENCAVALHLTAGHAHDGRQFEALYESLEVDNVLEFAALDEGYDADRIRERLTLDGIEAVIPPISSRSKKLPYDKELYRSRNRVERFFNKLQQFRRLATRYDKLAKTFFAAVCLVAAFLITKNS